MIIKYLHGLIVLMNYLMYDIIIQMSNKYVWKIK